MPPTLAHLQSHHDGYSLQACLYLPFYRGSACLNGKRGLPWLTVLGIQSIMAQTAAGQQVHETVGYMNQQRM